VDTAGGGLMRLTQIGDVDVSSFCFCFFCLGPPTFSIANINLEIEPPFFLVATTWDYSQVICIYIFIFGIHLGTILYCMFFLVLYFFVKPLHCMFFNQAPFLKAVSCCYPFGQLLASLRWPPAA